VPNTSIGIVGGTIHGNRGAQAMLESLVGRLRRHDSGYQFTIFSYYPEKDAELITDPLTTVASAKPIDLVLKIFPCAMVARLAMLVGLTCPSGLLPRDVVKLRQCAILLDIAGISFSDGREKFLPFNILTIWPAMLLGVPVVKCAQALGPFEGRTNRLAANWFLGRCKRIFGRGKETLDHLEKLRPLVGRIQESSDLAFLHEPEYALSDEGTARTEALVHILSAAEQAEKPLICVCPSNVVAGAGEDYVQGIASILLQLGDTGKRVVLLPTATREGSTKTHNNDLLLIRNIYSATEAPGKEGWLYIVDWDLGFSDIKNVIQISDAVMTFRFHGLIAALSTKRPVLAVGWGHKYRELMEQFDLSDFELDYGKFSIAEVLERVETLVENQAALTRQIEESLPPIVALCEEQLAYVQKELDKGTHG